MTHLYEQTRNESPAKLHPALKYPWLIHLRQLYMPSISPDISGFQSSRRGTGNWGAQYPPLWDRQIKTQKRPVWMAKDEPTVFYFLYRPFSQDAQSRIWTIEWRTDSGTDGFGGPWFWWIWIAWGLIGSNGWNAHKHAQVVLESPNTCRTVYDRN